MTESDSAEDSVTPRPSRSRVCKQCKFSTTDTWLFTQHQLNAHQHEAAAIHVCEECNYATASYTDWQRHQKTHSALERQSSEISTGSLCIDEGSPIVTDIISPEPAFTPEMMNPSEIDPVVEPMEPTENDDDTRLKRSLPTRNYTCQVCFAATTSAKQHLRHLVEKHGQNISIYECDMCEYATRWKHKLPRHIKCHYTSFSPKSRSPTMHNTSKSPTKAVNQDKPHAVSQAERDVLLFQKIQTSAASKPSDLGIDYEEDPDDSWINSEMFKQENQCIMSSADNQDYLRSSSEGQGRIKKPPVREAVDPNKYVELDDPVNGTRYSCSVCGNVYKWRKSLNKHWKDKHEKEIGSINGNRAAVLNVPKIAQVKQSNVNIQKETISAVVKTPTATPVYRSQSPPEEGFSFSKYERQYGSSSVLYGDGPTWLNESKDSPMYEEQYDLEPGEKRPGNHQRSSTYPAFSNKDSQSSSLLQALSAPKFGNGQNKGIAKPKPVYPTPIRIKQETERYPPVVDFTCKTNVGNNRAIEVLDLSRKSPPAGLSEDQDWMNITLKSNSQAYQSEPLDLCVKKPSKDKQEMTPKETKENNNNYTEEYSLPSEELQCSKCAYICRDRADYEKHVEMHLPTRTQKCGECRAVFCSVQDLNDHFATHHSQLMSDKEASDVNDDDSPFLESRATEHRCHICEASYMSNYEFIRHFEIMHPSIPSSFRKKRTNSSNSDVQDSKRAKSTPTWESGSELMKHLLPRTSEGLYECTACPFTSRTEGQMAVHMKNLHQLQMKQTHHQTLQEDVESNGMVFPQRIAVAVSPTPLSINTDITDNMSSPAQLTPTSQCSSLSPRSRSGNSEMLLPYKCSVCEYRARWPSEITQHMKNHSDEKPYLCPGCPYRSKWKWDVVKHMKRCKDALGGSIDDVIDTTGSMERRRRKYAPRKKISPVEDFEGYKPLSRGPPNVVVVPNSDTPKSAFVHEGGHQQAEQYPSIMKRLEMQPGETEEMMNDIDRESPVNLSNISRSMEAQFEPDMGEMESDSDEIRSELESHMSNSGSYVPPSGMIGFQGIDGNSRPNSASNSPNFSKNREKQGQNVNQHPCRYCPFIGQSPAELKRHSAVHSDQKPFSCDDCDYRTKWKCDLKKHMRIYNHLSNCVGLTKKRKSGSSLPRESYSPQESELGHTVQELQLLKCDKCEYVSYKKTALDSHQRIHQNKASKGLKCRQCGFEANDLPSFLQHNLSHVTDNKSIDSIDNDEKTSFDASMDLSGGHMAKLTGKSATLKHRRKPIAILVCSECPYTCNKKANLQLHKSMHGNRGANTVQCHFCDYSVFSKGLLRQHMLLHEEYSADVIGFSEENKYSDIKDSLMEAEGVNTKQEKGKMELVDDKQSNDAKAVTEDKYFSPDKHVEKNHEAVNEGNSCDDLVNNHDVKTDADAYSEMTKDGNQSKSEASMFSASIHLKESDNLENCDKKKNEKKELVEENNNTVITSTSSKQEDRASLLKTMNLNEQDMFKSEKVNEADNKEPKLATLEGELSESDNQQEVKKGMENNNTRLDDKNDLVKMDNKEMKSVDEPAHNVSTNTELTEFSKFGMSEEENEMCDNEIEPGEIVHGSNSFINGRQEFMIHQCTHCPFVTRETMFYNRHLEMHEYKGKFTCKYCNYSLDKLNFLVKHMKVHSDSYIESTECIEEQESDNMSENEKQPNIASPTSSNRNRSKNSERYQELIARLKENSSYDSLGPPQVAPLAGTHFDAHSLESMKNSLYKKAVLGLSTRSRIVYRCALCPFTSGSKSNMNKHKNAHLIKNKYQCEECSYSARKWTLLQWHQKSHKETEKPAGHEQCRYVTIHLDGSETEESTLLETMNTHVTPEGYYKEMEFFKDHGYENDEFENMSTNSIPETVTGYHKGMECFKEKEADSSTVRSLLLAPQLNLLRPIAPKPVNMGASSMVFVPLKKKKKTRYHCEKCPYGSNSLFEYQKHTQLHGSPLRYRCDYCDYSLNRMNLMFQHRRLHADEPGFKRTPPPTELINKNVTDNSYRFKVEQQTNDHIKTAPQDDYEMSYNDLTIDEKDQNHHQGSDYIELSDEAMDFSMKSIDSNQPSNYTMENSLNSSHQRLLQPYGDPRSTTTEKELKRVSRIMTVTVEGKKRPKVWKMYKCPLCPFSCGSKQGYGIHESLHGSDGRYKCDECSYSVNRLNLLLQHSKLHMGIPKSVKINNGKKPLKCPKCPFRTHSPSILSSHLRMHTSGGKYTCQFCDYSIDRYNLIKQHMKIHFTYSGDDSNCEIVNENLLQQPKNEAELKCERCPFQTKSAYLFSKHAEGHMQDYSYKCKHCDYSCDDSVEIIHHTRLHFTGNEQTLDLRETNQDVTAKGTCCNDEQSEDYDEDACFFDNETELMCQYCDRVFINQLQLESHEQMHLVGCQ